MNVISLYGISLSTWDREKFSSFEEAVEAGRKELVVQEKEKLMGEDPALTDKEANDAAVCIVFDKEMLARKYNIPYTLVDDQLIELGGYENPKP